jgi:hypothetical protein
MTDSGLLAGFWLPVHGSERQAIKVFDEAFEYYSRLQQNGEIVSFEPVLFEPHGGELGGSPAARRLGRSRAHSDQRRVRADDGAG